MSPAWGCTVSPNYPNPPPRHEAVSKPWRTDAFIVEPFVRAHAASISQPPGRRRRSSKVPLRGMFWQGPPGGGPFCKVPRGGGTFSQGPPEGGGDLVTIALQGYPEGGGRFKTMYLTSIQQLTNTTRINPSVGMGWWVHTHSDYVAGVIR